MTAQARAFEPAPDGAEATEEWGAAWPAHRYGFGVLFAAVAAYAVAALARRRRAASRDEAGPGLRPDQAALAGVVGAGAARAYSLVVDTYLLDGSAWELPEPLEILLWNLGSTLAGLAVSMLYATLAAWSRGDGAGPLGLLAAPVVSQLALSLLACAVPTGATLAAVKAHLAAWTLALGLGYLVPAARRACRGGNKVPGRGAAAASLARAAAPAAALTATLGVCAWAAFADEYAAGDRAPGAWPFLLFHTLVRALELALLAHVARAVARGRRLLGALEPVPAAAPAAAADDDKYDAASGAVFSFDGGVLDAGAAKASSPESRIADHLRGLGGRTVAASGQLTVDVARDASWGGVDFSATSPRRFCVSRSPSPRPSAVSADSARSSSEMLQERHRLSSRELTSACSVTVHGAAADTGGAAAAVAAAAAGRRTRG